MDEITKENLWKTIGQRINSLLGEQNIQQNYLAKKIGVKPPEISYWCKGERAPNAIQLVKVADELNTTSDYLLGLTDYRYPLKTDEDKTERQVCDYTGLSPKAVKALAFLREHHSPHPELDLINYLLEHYTITIVDENGEKVIGDGNHDDNLLNFLTNYLFHIYRGEDINIAQEAYSVPNAEDAQPTSVGFYVDKISRQDMMDFKNKERIEACFRKIKEERQKRQIKLEEATDHGNRNETR